MTPQTEQAFLYEYVETGYFDYEDRPKTLAAMRRCFECIPQCIWEEMPPLVVFAPSPWKLGEVHPFGYPQAIIYLAPHLENEPQEQVDFTVAHEFAHVIRGHYLPGNSEVSAPFEKEREITHENAPSEIAADRLAESWGFKRPQGITSRAAND